MAQFNLTGDQPLSHRHTMIEDKAFALPLTLTGRNIFQIAQYSAFQMIDIIDPFRF